MEPGRRRLARPVWRSAPLPAGESAQGACAEERLACSHLIPTASPTRNRRVARLLPATLGQAATTGGRLVPRAVPHSVPNVARGSLLRRGPRLGTTGPRPASRRAWYVASDWRGTTAVFASIPSRSPRWSGVQRGTPRACCPRNQDDSLWRTELDGRSSKPDRRAKLRNWCVQRAGWGQAAVGPVNRPRCALPPGHEALLHSEVIRPSLIGRGGVRPTFDMGK